MGYICTQCRDEDDDDINAGYNQTSAHVDFAITNTSTWQDALQFGVPGDLTWSLTGQTFVMDLRFNKFDATPKLTMTTGNGRIITDDVVQRVIHFNVNKTDLQANLPIGRYYHEIIMQDGSNPPVRVTLAHGTVDVSQGATNS